MTEDIHTKEEITSFIEKIIFINRCTKVTKGGKNLHFSSLIVVGDGKGRVGASLGKANEVADAIRKGIKQAKKNLMKLNLKDGHTIPYEVQTKFGAVEVLLKPAKRGTGVIACGPIRAVCECAGIKDLRAKVLRRSSNPINVIYATLQALKEFEVEEEDSLGINRGEI